MNDILWEAFSDELQKVAHNCRGDILRAFQAEGGALGMPALLKRTKKKHSAHHVRKELAKMIREGVVKRHPHGDLYTVSNKLEKRSYQTMAGSLTGANSYMQGMMRMPVAQGGAGMRRPRMGMTGMRRPMRAGMRAVSQPAMGKTAGYSKAQKALLGIKNTTYGKGYHKAGVNLTGAQHRRIKELYNSKTPGDREQARQFMQTLAPSVPESEYDTLFQRFSPKQTGLKTGDPKKLSPGKMFSRLRKLDMLEKKNPEYYESLMDGRGGSFNFRRMVEPYLKKQAEVTHRGVTFPGYNKPIASNRKGKKKMVLVKRGDKIRIVHFGQKGYQDFTQHKDKKRRKNYLTRSAGIRNKSGQLTKDDPFSPNYWARRELW